MIRIDLEAGTVEEQTAAGLRTFEIGSPEAFRLISKAWLRSGWDSKYVYSFTWLGRPMIQLPEDMLRIQEVIYSVKPDVLIETGVAHGGSLVFYASLFRSIGKGRVVGVDVEVRPHNRKAIEAHELFPSITLIEGDSTDSGTLAMVRRQLKAGDTAMVVLDSNHTKAHVLAELEAYAPFVTPQSYIVATDGIMQDLVGAPRSRDDWEWNNPAQAAREFAARHPEYALIEPPVMFNEGTITERVTYWPHAFLLRKA